MQVAYTSSAVKALVGKPQARKDVVEKVLASVGGKLVSFHFCFGDYDVVLIATEPRRISPRRLGERGERLSTDCTDYSDSECINLPDVTARPARPRRGRSSLSRRTIFSVICVAPWR